MSENRPQIPIDEPCNWTAADLSSAPKPYYRLRGRLEKERYSKLRAFQKDSGLPTDAPAAVGAAGGAAARLDAHAAYEQVTPPLPSYHPVPSPLTTPL